VTPTRRTQTYTADQLEAMLTTTEAAQHMGLSMSRIHQLRRENVIHPLKTPLGYLFDATDLDARIIRTSAGTPRPNRRKKAQP